HPNYFSARVAVGRALLESNVLEEAREEFEKVLQQVPDNLLALKFLGETYPGLGQLQEALSKYKLAGTLSPEDTDLVDRIGRVEAAIAAPPATTQSAPPPAGPASDAGAPPMGEQSAPPTIPPARQSSSFLIERQASEIGGSDSVSEDVRSIQEEIEDQPVTSIFKRQAREIMDLGSIPQPMKKGEEPPLAAPGVPPGVPDDANEPAPPVEPASVPPGVPRDRESAATPPIIVPQQSPPAPTEPPPASAKPEFGIPQEPQELALPASGQPEFGIPSEPQELLPPDEPAPPVPKAAPPAGVDQSGEAPVVPAAPALPVEPVEPVPSAPVEPMPIEPIESVEPMPIESPPFQQTTEPVQPVQPAVEPLGVGATEGPAPAEEDKPGLATETLAELYASQGHLDRALAVYRQLVATQPDRVELHGRMEELEMLVKASQEPAPSERGEGGADPNVRALEEAIRALEGWLVAIGRS
ncbi:MAG: hypothetical protein V3V11_00460, partial [Vicinamibacteria bacterium]